MFPRTQLPSECKGQGSILGPEFFIAMQLCFSVLKREVTFIKEILCTRLGVFAAVVVVVFSSIEV